jgi:uncharacterized protein (DUF1778 family)
MPSAQQGQSRLLDVSGRMPYALLMASISIKTSRLEIEITEEERGLEQAAAERTRYVLDDKATQRFLSALEQPSPDSEPGLRRLVEKPSILPEA